MGKNKLKKFGEMETFPNVFQYPFAELQKGPFPLKGKWNTEFFKNDNPIVLELGCGKGEYAVGMAKNLPTATSLESTSKAPGCGPAPSSRCRKASPT